MVFLRCNINELIVKIYYIFGTGTFLVAYITNLLGTYQQENFFFAYLLINFLALYTALYSIYFFVRYRYDMTRKIELLKTSRKFSLVYSLAYLIVSLVAIKNQGVQVLVMELLFAAFIIFCMIFNLHLNRVKRQFNKRIVWIEG